MTVPAPLQRRASTILGVLAAVALLAAGLQDGWALAWIGFPIIGAAILWQGPGNRIGWLCLAAGGLLAVTDWGQTYVGGPPGRGPVLLEEVVLVLGAWSFLALIGIVVLFPSGAPTTRATRVVWRAPLGLMVVYAVLMLVSPLPLDNTGRTNPWGVAWLEPVASFFFGPAFLVVPLLMVVGLTSLVARWRRSTGVERLQYRWFLSAVLVSVVAIILVFATQWESLWLLAMLNAMPVAIGVAITRYGLFEFDRIISRTASYTIVTGLLLATYALVVTSVSRVLGETSTLAVAAATLAAAALFRPLLSRVQRVIDHRFNREKVDHQRAIDDFAARLRDRLDELEVGDDLVLVTSQTLAPDRARLWIRGSTA